ncbi:hypothetical protein MTP99_018370 [Tenebrio molitor]|nr:hypothetical protein MTP99_018370 [Tenebrio molitor]
MKAVALLVLPYLFWASQCWDVMQIGGKQARFDRFDGICRGYKDIKIVFNYYGIRNVGNKLYMNSTIVVKEDIPDPPSLSLTMKRCRSRENLDTCEDFHSFTTKHYCKLIQSDSELWNPFFATIEPKWKCPIKKGTYKSINSSFDVTAFLLFPVDEWFWRVRGDMFDGRSGKRIMCVIIEAKVIIKKKP